MVFVVQLLSFVGVFRLIFATTIQLIMLSFYNTTFSQALGIHLLQGGTLNATSLNYLGATTSKPANVQPLGLTSSLALLDTTSLFTGQLNVGNALTATNSNNAWELMILLLVLQQTCWIYITGPLTSVGNGTTQEFNSSNESFASPTLGARYQTQSTIIATPLNTSVPAPAQNFLNAAGQLGSPQQQQGQNQRNSQKQNQVVVKQKQNQQ